MIRTQEAHEDWERGVYIFTGSWNCSSTSLLWSIDGHAMISQSSSSCQCWQLSYGSLVLYMCSHCRLPILLLASHEFPWNGRDWLFCLSPNPIPKPGSFTPWSIMAHSALTLWSLPPTPVFTCLPTLAGPYSWYNWSTTFKDLEAFSTISSPSPDNIAPSCTPELGTSIHPCVH